MGSTTLSRLVARMRLARRKLLVACAMVMFLIGSKTYSYVSHRPVDVQPSNPRVRQDLQARSRYLVAQAQALSTGEMPWYLPDQFKGEWLAVTYSMTAMALANLAFLYPETAGDARRALGTLSRAMLAKDVREFDAGLWNEDPLDSLEGPNGHIGYLGHLELVLLAEQYVGGGSEREDLARDVAVALHRRMIASPSLHAETYPGQTFVADNTVIVACLALAQPLFPGRDLSVTEAWVKRTEGELLDPDTGLMVFRIARDGKVLETSRGSGAAWGIFYLSYADRAFAERQYRILHDAMADSAVFGLVRGIREYPPGVAGAGDVDSGPVVLGLSPSGTGFALAGATMAGDRAFKLDLLRTAELVGTSLTTSGGTRYLFAPMVGDAILLAMRTTTGWSERFRQGSR